MAKDPLAWNPQESCAHLWIRVLSQLLDSIATRAACNSHELVSPNAQHVATFKGRGRLNLRHIAILPDRWRNPGNFIAPSLASGPRQNRNLIKHQRRVLKKTGIRTPIIGRELMHLNSQAPQHFLVLLMLSDRTLEVNRQPVNKC